MAVKMADSIAKIFILDTSTPACTLALKTPKGLFTFHDYPSQGKLRHNEQLIPAFQDLLKQAEITPKDLTAVYFGHGPGSFTGCRMAASFGQGLAAGSQIACHSLSSFALIAQGIYKALNHKTIAIAQDAQKNQIYFGLYQLNPVLNLMQPKIDPCLIRPEELASPHFQSVLNSIQDKIILSGNAWFLQSDKIPQHPNFFSDPYAENWQIRAEDGLDLIAQKQIFPPEIIYLREASDWKTLPHLLPLKTYTVGGAVRDELLGLTPKEIDTLVIGATPEEMIARGYLPVGKHFPVFLHPETHAEFALARTERKISRGHQGFEFFTSPNITVEEDLKRRDFTMNAIAKDQHNHLIDPYHGQEDIKNRLIKHVSESFIEDPLRVFRGARFLAQLGKFNFKIAPETLTLMTAISHSGELEALSDERICEEIFKALKHPSYAYLFFDALVHSGAINRCFSEFTPVIQEATLPSLLENISIQADSLFCIFAFYSEPKIKIPKSVQELLSLSQHYYSAFCTLSHAQPENLPEHLLELLEKLDFFRRPERFWQVIFILKTIAQIEQKNTPITLIQQGTEALKNLNLSDITQNHSGPNPNMGKMIHQKRLDLLRTHCAH